VAAYDERWIRWIEASVVSYLKAGFTAAGIATKYSGEAEELGALDKYVEVILDGPHVAEIAKDDYEVHLTIMVLVEYQVTNDIYESADVVGKAISLLRAIPVYRKGDDDVMIGCLESDVQSTREWNGRDQGVNDPQTDMHQRSIEAELMMEL